MTVGYGLTDRLLFLLGWNLTCHLGSITLKSIGLILLHMMSVFYQVFLEGLFWAHCYLVCMCAKLNVLHNCTILKSTCMQMTSSVVLELLVICL